MVVLLAVSACAQPPAQTVAAAPVPEQDAATRAENLRQAAVLSQAWRENRQAVDPGLQQSQAQAAYQRAVAQRAHADCVYQAQMANVTSPGLVNGLLTGIAAGSVCENYYRSIGVIQ